MRGQNVLMIEQAFITLGGREILHSAGIRVCSGKITGLLGSNGSGKSTMLQMLFGSRKGDDAVVSYRGRRLKCPAFTVNGLVNFLPQFTILPSNVPMSRFMQLFRVSREELLSNFPELEADLHLSVGELSGGKLRLWQSLLLIFAPTLFTLLDEPFTHLSPMYVEHLKPLLRALCSRKGFLLTDHMYQPLMEVTDELWFMKSGQTFLIRQPEDLVLHGYARAFW